MSTGTDGRGNSVHPSAVLGPDVHLGSGNTIGPGVVLLGPLRIGNDNWIGAHAVIGGPQRSRASTTVPPGTASWSGRG